MIQVVDVVKSYGLQLLFDKCSFSINAGEHTGLIGRNGHGKTTLFRMLLGMERPDSGSISIPDGYRIGHLSQHIRFKCDTVLKEACLSLPVSDDRVDQTYKAETILAGLGFSEEELGSDPMELSGGFQVRLNLAKVLISNPNLLLLDEPTNYLDIVSLRWLERFLLNWQGEFLLITHDRAFMDSVTTHTMAIHRSKIRKVEGSTDKVYQQLLLEEEIYEKTRVNDEKKRSEAEQFINRFRAKASKARAVQSRIKALQKNERHEELSRIKNLEFAFSAATFTGRQLMEVKDLAFGFQGDESALIRDLSFYVGKGDRIGIIGRNGRGKTTLLNLLATELLPVSGTVRHHKHLRHAYFGQTNILRLNPDNTVEEEIMQAHPVQQRGMARGICGAMMFPGDLALKKIRVLSGGEKSRVLLGKLLVSPANMLLLDEPTNHLDMESTESLLDAVDAFSGAVIIVTHSEMILHALVKRLIVFDGGRVFLFEGTYQEFLDRVGWENEQEAVKSRTKETAPSVNKKDLRRKRAGLISAKSKTLGALQKQIVHIEQEIIRLEEKNIQDNTELLEASLAGNGEIIKKLSRAIHMTTKRIDSLFSELEVVHAELDQKTKEFDDQLKYGGSASN